MTEAPRSAILERIRRRGPTSIDELAASLGLSKTAARAHVLRLEKRGLIARVEAEPVGPGRPRARFALTQRGGETFPNADAAVLERLLTFLERQGRRDLIVEFFTEYWSERRASLLRSLRVSSFGASRLDQRLEALETLLAHSEFMPRIERRSRAGRKLVVVHECNCPLPAAVRATRIPCQLETQFLAEVVGGTPVATSIAAHRGETCRFELRVEPGDA